jgi:hypothetical protein
MTLTTRPISWLKAALKDFERFPEGAQSTVMSALTIAAEGGKADIAKPMHAMGSGMFEIALPFRGDAFVSSTLSRLRTRSGSCMRFRRNPIGVLRRQNKLTWSRIV